MKKLILDPDELRVESFDTSAGGGPRGTVHAHATYPEWTCVPTECVSCGSTCYGQYTCDGYQTCHGHYTCDGYGTCANTCELRDTCGATACNYSCDWQKTCDPWACAAPTDICA